MTSLKGPEAGQSAIEAILGAGLMLVTIVFGTLLLINLVGKLILTKWASHQAYCVAERQPTTVCELKTKRDLEKYFPFKNIRTQVQVDRGQIHSRVDAMLIESVLIRSRYDLGPWEYRRTAK
jgi:hypothetical protein